MAEIGSQTTLRYAVQLLNPAYQLAKSYHNEAKPVITKTTLNEVKDLFSDAKQSASILTKHAGYMK